MTFTPTVRCILILFLTVIGLGQAHAQSFHFVPFSVQDGLPQSQIRSTFQDSRGFLWFASAEGGISRYDGATFVNYSEDQGLPSNLTTTFAEDNSGNLWIGSERGLSWFDGKTFYPYEQSPFPTQGWVKDIVADSQGGMWVVIDGQSLHYIHNGSNQEIELPLKLANEVLQSLSLSRNNQLYVCTSLGIYLLDTESPSEKGTWLFRNTPFNERFLTSSDYDAKTGTLWVGSRVGLFRLENGKLIPVKPNAQLDIRDVLVDNWGWLWVASNENGVYLYSNEEWRHFTTEDGLTDENTTQLTEDRVGNIWITSQVGVSRMTGRMFEHLAPKDGLADKLVWAVLAEHDSSIWVGHNQGLSHWDGQTFTDFGPEQGFEGGHPSHFARDEYGRLWMACVNGIWWYDGNRFGRIPDTEKWHNARGYVLLAPGNGKLYIGGNASLETIDLRPGNNFARSRIYLRKTICSQGFNSYWLGPEGDIWVATEGNGIARIKKEGTLSFFTEREGLSANVVNELKSDGQGRLWAATSAGVSCLDLTSEHPRVVFNIGTLEGLLSPNVYSLLWQAKDTLWLGTDRGIHRLVFAQDSLVSNQSYVAADGFKGIEANHRTVSMSAEGTIWWGTIAGLTAYHPDRDVVPSKSPELYFTHLDLFYDRPDWGEMTNQPTNWFGVPQELTLRPRQNTLTFHYQGVSLNQGSQLQYKHRLLGLEEEWSPITNRTEVRYTNLSPGEYTLEVMAATNTGKWTDPPLSFSFTINSFLWQRPWFIGLLAMLAVAIVLGYVRLRLQFLRRARRLLSQKIIERTAEIVQQKHEIEAQRDQIEMQRDELAYKSRSLEDALRDLERHSLQVTSSIHYAKRIQDSMLPLQKTISQAFPNHFIYYQPKDIVSGDFYWYGYQNGAHIVAAIDCTGHGVPGAIMSMVGAALLNQTVLEKGINDPSTILKLLHTGVRLALKQEDRDLFNSDGMDVALASISLDDKQFLYAGAKRPLFLVRNGELKEFSGERSSIGGYHTRKAVTFHNHHYDLQEGDMLYFTSDGYMDQFGGPRFKKFMLKRFKNLIVEIAPLPVADQRHKLEQEMSRWMRSYEQTDDMLIFGIRI